jgi:hypothetical protein
MRALVAATTLGWDTLFLAVSALDLALGINKALSALEAGGAVPKEAPSPPVASPGQLAAAEEGIAQREFKFQDKFRGEPHELRIRRDGIFELCSNGCGIFEQRIAQRVESLTGGPPWGDFEDATAGLIERARANDIASIKAQQELDALEKLGGEATEAQNAAAKKLNEQLKKLGEAQRQVEQEMEAIEERAAKNPNRDPITGEPTEFSEPTDRLEFDPETLEFTDPVTLKIKHGFGSADEARNAFERAYGKKLTLDPAGFTPPTDVAPEWRGISVGHCGVYEGKRYVGTVWRNVYQDHTFFTFSRGEHR